MGEVRREGGGVFFVFFGEGEVFFLVRVCVCFFVFFWRDGVVVFFGRRRRCGERRGGGRGVGMGGRGREGGREGGRERVWWGWGEGGVVGVLWGLGVRLWGLILGSAGRKRPGMGHGVRFVHVPYFNSASKTVQILKIGQK